MTPIYMEFKLGNWRPQIPKILNFYVINPNKGIGVCQFINSNFYLNSNVRYRLVRDETFCPTFVSSKTGGTRYSTGRILGEFSFRLTPGTTLSTSVEHKIITSPSPSSSSLFPSEGIFAPCPSCPVCIPNDT
ncbi:hypothetical protein DVH24_012485 [Malus domestica]|uniref:Uncharacterized protein n=1 Tax=Malus domestica TaxID=3750 RepID=A0A498HUG6_MALDO|nr:hypothetical protein DVH24_012485 [Malus domestica]